jgi:hypothetical protein
MLERVRQHELAEVRVTIPQTHPVPHRAVCVLRTLFDAQLNSPSPCVLIVSSSFVVVDCVVDEAVNRVVHVD